MIGYLDIETSFDGELTVVGLLRPGGELVQLVGTAITQDALAHALSGVDGICTFNGDRFDLPELSRALGVDLLARYRSLDLWVECARAGFRGGLKWIEERHGILRNVPGVSGYDAMVLWRQWQTGDERALTTLLSYNADDVVNLVLLERRLRHDLAQVNGVRRIVLGP